VPRRVKDFIEISEYTSLDDLIKFLKIIRASLPADGEAELKIRGDEIFGHRLTISFLRELTPEEAALEAKYGGDALPEDDAAIEELRGKLDKVPYSGTKTNRR
jgi:hypothetical protein